MRWFTSVILLISILAVSQSQRVLNRNSGTQTSHNRDFATQTSQERGFVSQRADDGWNFDEQPHQNRGLTAQNSDQNRNYHAHRTDGRQNVNARNTDESQTFEEQWPTNRPSQSRSQNTQRPYENRNVNTQRQDDSRSFIGLQSQQDQYFNAPSDADEIIFDTQRPTQRATHRTIQRTTQRPHQNTNQNTQRQNENQNYNTQRQDENRNVNTQRQDDNRSYIAIQSQQDQNYNAPSDADEIIFDTQRPTQRTTHRTTQRTTQRPHQNTNQNTQRQNENQNFNTQRQDENRNVNTQRQNDNRTFIAIESQQDQIFNSPNTDGIFFESQRPTQRTTQRPTQRTTQRPTQRTTQRSTQRVTQSSTQSRNPNTQRPIDNQHFNTQSQSFNTHGGIQTIVGQASQCKTYEWQCDNGQCIDSSESCDGIQNCRDGSDETTENCIGTTCPKYAFRCTYGACVAGNAECNRQIDCVDGSDEATEKCPTKTESQLHGSCDGISFQCDNGECIGVDLMCDGNPDCSDFSDEIVKYCAGIHCPTFAFRCGNGACINGKKKCDSRIDCMDGSDENWALCGTSRNHTITVRPPVNPFQTVTMGTAFQTATPNTPPPPNLASCRADVIPVNGDAYFQYDGNKKVAYGEIVENFVSINYTCIENHYLIGNATNICISGRWQYPAPHCRPRCSSAEIQGVTISANCFSIVNNTQKSTSCVRPVVPGTIAYVSCQRGYEKTGPQQTLTCQQDGRWSPQPQKCTQICGEINEGAAYVVGGATTNITRVPWHVGVYKRNSNDAKFQQICGGTILTSRVVISAMHCFWDASEDSSFRPEAFQVAVGKTNRDYSAHEDYKPQFFSIEHIFYIDGYNDLANYYADDIAILVLDKHIEFHSFIVPICLPQNLEYHEKIVPVGWRGITAGWGLEESNGKPSPILKKIELPVVSREECKDKSSPEFGNFITSDKFCAGYLTGASVCQGDSGGGLVFPQTVRHKTTYIIRGIVSTGGNKAGSCDSDKYTTFTNIAFHMDFINAHISKYEPKY